MARMYATDASQYPRIGRLAQFYLPRLHSANARTWQAFVQYSTISASAADAALQWGHGPQLRFTGSYLPNHLAGQFVAAGSTEASAIWIRSDVARAIERDWNRWEARLRAEALLLHEMTHWCDYSQDHTLSTTETGEAFERAAYGGFQPVRWSYALRSYPASLMFQAPPLS